MVRYFGLNDKRVESIMQTLHDEHLQIFKDLSNLTMNLKLESGKEVQQMGQVESGGKSEENLRLKEELAEMQEQMRELEEENKKYLDMIIRHSKGESVKNVPQKQQQ